MRMQRINALRVKGTNISVQNLPQVILHSHRATKMTNREFVILKHGEARRTLQNLKPMKIFESERKLFTLLHSAALDSISECC